jgi:hypothetical protein
MSVKKAIYFFTSCLCLYFVYFLLTENAKRVYQVSQQKDQKRRELFINESCLIEKSKLQSILNKYQNDEKYKELFDEIRKGNVKYE